MSALPYAARATGLVGSVIDSSTSLLHEQTHTEDTAVLVVTHNREIARVAHRVIELSSGRVVADGPNPGGPAEISELHW